MTLLFLFVSKFWWIKNFFCKVLCFLVTNTVYLPSYLNGYLHKAFFCKQTFNQLFLLGNVTYVIKNGNMGMDFNYSVFVWFLKRFQTLRTIPDTLFDRSTMGQYHFVRSLSRRLPYLDLFVLGCVNFCTLKQIQVWVKKFSR